MSATRNSSMRALRQLSSHSHQVRQLHITGPATFPSRILTSERNVLPNLPKDVDSLRAECSKRGLPATGSKDELIARLTSPATPGGGNESASRAFSSVPASGPRVTGPRLTRQINTSRSLKAPKDSSTMDFTYLPAEPAPNPMDNVNMRVPLLPDSHSSSQVGIHAPETPSYENVTKQTIVTAAADSTHVSAPSAMSDVHDNTAAPVDYPNLADRLETAAAGVKASAKRSQGTLGKLWEDVVDDIFGPKRIGGMA